MDSLQITTADAELLREILARWDHLSNLKDGDLGFQAMTDHCHDLYVNGFALAEKLAHIAASQPSP